jgi:hypothetical protein
MVERAVVLALMSEMNLFLFLNRMSSGDSQDGEGIIVYDFPHATNFGEQSSFPKLFLLYVSTLYGADSRHFAFFRIKRSTNFEQYVPKL